MRRNISSCGIDWVVNVSMPGTSCVFWDRWQVRQLSCRSSRGAAA